jgi:MarR-like DNA-binding transcriptional regulator SgrR of sgrS sRNA
MLKTRLIGMALCLLLYSLMSGITGCSPEAGSTPESTTSQSSTTAETAATPSASLDSRPQKSSGTMRLWWIHRDTLNPLLDNSQSGRAINRLIFQSLYQIDERQQSVPQLAVWESTLWGGTQVIVKLRPGLVFHDGTPILASDVAACLRFILTHAEQSQYAAELSQVSQATALDDITVQLTLSQPDPWLNNALTFPVIPEKCLNEDPFKLIPGSGPYFMESYSRAEGLVIKAAAEQKQVNELTTIQVIEYNNFVAAMRGFENDEFDLVSLSAAEYNRYQLRQSLRFEPYTTGQLMLISYNTAPRQPLSNGDQLLYLKQVLQPGDILARCQEAWGGEAVEVPVPFSSWLLDGQTAPVSEILHNLGPAVWNENNRKLVLLVPQGEALYADLAAAVGKCLDEAQVAWRLNALPLQDFWTQFQEGRFDLALLEADLAIGKDPALLFRDNRPAAYMPLNQLPVKGLADYDLWRQNLISLLTVSRADAIPTGAHLAGALAETTARSPFSMVLVRCGALLYGSRVIGQCRPIEDNPYQGIEELWVWSG